MSKAINTRTVSPSQLQSYSKSPISYLMHRYSMVGRGGSLQSKYLGEHIPGTAENIMGTHIHDSLEEAFGVFKNLYEKNAGNPSEKFIENVINQSVSHAAKALETRGMDSTIHGNFFKEVIGRYGKMYHKRVQKHMKAGVPLDEVMSKVTLNVEKQLQAFVGDTANPSSRIIRGRFDLLLSDTIDKTALIADYKNLFTEQMLSDIEGAGWQPKAYKYALCKMRPNTYNNIEFEYAISMPGAEVDSIRGALFRPFKGESDVAVVEKELMEKIAEMESYKSIGYGKLQRGGEKAWKAWIKNELIPEVYDKVSGKELLSIPEDLRYNWRVEDFIDEVLDKDGLNGEKFLSTVQNKSEQPGPDDLRMFSKETLKGQTKEAIADLFERNQKSKVRLEELRKDISTGKVKPNVSEDILDELLHRVDNEADLLARSYNTAQGYKKNAFTNRVLRGAYSARTKLPISILDESFSAPWLTERMRKVMDYTAKDRIKTIAHALDVPDYAISRDIMKNVFTDKTLVEKLHHGVIQNIRNKMDDMKLYPNKSNVEYMLKHPEYWIDKTLSATVDQKLSDETIRQIMRTESGKVLKYAKGIDFKGVLTEEQLKTVKTGLVDKGIMKEAPELFMEQMAKSQSFGGMLGLHSLSEHRFPISSIALTGLLAYIAGSMGIVRNISRKIEKAGQYLTMQDDEVKTGDHASSYTTSRRLMLSDFGSSYRKFTGPGTLASSLVARGIHGLKNFKTLVTRGTAAERVEGSSLNAFKSAMGGIDTRKLMHDISESPLSPAFLFTAAAIGTFVASGLMTGGGSPDESASKYEDRKKRFKRLKKVKWNTDSVLQEPQSDLRQAYKMNTPFGSGIFAVEELLTGAYSAFRYINMSNVDDLVAGIKELAESTGTVWKDTKGVVAKLFNEVKDDVAAIASESTAKAVPSETVQKHLVRRVAKKAAEDIRLVHTQAGIRDKITIGNKQLKLRTEETKEYLSTLRSNLKSKKGYKTSMKTLNAGSHLFDAYSLANSAKPKDYPVIIKSPPKKPNVLVANVVGENQVGHGSDIRTQFDRPAKYEGEYVTNTRLRRTNYDNGVFGDNVTVPRTDYVYVNLDKQLHSPGLVKSMASLNQVTDSAKVNVQLETGTPLTNGYNIIPGRDVSTGMFRQFDVPDHVRDYQKNLVTELPQLVKSTSNLGDFNEGMRNIMKTWRSPARYREANLRNTFIG